VRGGGGGEGDEMTTGPHKKTKNFSLIGDSHFELCHGLREKVMHLKVMRVRDLINFLRVIR
jgi:hypothetical protein